MTATPLNEILLTPCRGVIRGDGGYAELIVNQKSWAAGITVAALDSTPALAVIATADGRSMIREAHTGPEAEAVYVERYEAGLGCTFHGFIDERSRRIVQWG